MKDNSMKTQKKKGGRPKKQPGEARYVPSKGLPEITAALKTCGLIVDQSKKILEANEFLDHNQLNNFKTATEILWRQRELILKQRRMRLDENAFKYQVKLSQQTDPQLPATDLSQKTTAELLKIIDAVIVSDDKTNVKKK